MIAFEFDLGLVALIFGTTGLAKKFVEFVPDAPTPGAPANVTLFVDGANVAQVRIAVQVPMRCGAETMDVGMDCRSPVCDDYEKLGLFPFTGTIESVTLTLGDGHQPTGMERLELATKMD